MKPSSIFFYPGMIILLVLVSCSKSSEDSENEKPLVRIDDKILTKGMLHSSIPNSLSDEDSVVFAEGYINQWVRSELLLRKAELNLTPEEKNIDHLLEEYRRSLLIQMYQQKLLEQKYSPLITGSEIETYYNEMMDNFKLDHHIIKGVFAIVPKSAPNINEFKKLYRSDDSDDIVKLEAYCFKNAKGYELFLDHWLPMDVISKKLPEEISNKKKFITNNNYYQTSDSAFYYFLAIKDYKLSSDIAPMEYVEENIKSILLNKKRIQFIKQMETDLYEEALKNKNISFY